MRTTLISCFLVICTFSVLAQSSEITISEKGFIRKSTVYTKCDIELTNAQLIGLFGKNPSMSEFYKPMAWTYAGSTLLKSASGVLIFLPLTDMIDNKKPNWNLLYIGAACALVAIPLDKAFDKHAKKGVNYYNTSIKEKSAVDVSLNLGITGAGLVVKF